MWQYILTVEDIEKRQSLMREIPVWLRLSDELSITEIGKTIRFSLEDSYREKFDIEIRPRIQNEVSVEIKFSE